MKEKYDVTVVKHPEDHLINYEKMLKTSLKKVDKQKAKQIIARHIKDNRLHSEYIEMVLDLSKDYIDKANEFIIQIKQDANFFYQNKIMQTKILENIKITKDNWFWYARILRDTEDEIYPNRNYFKPTILLEKLLPIITDIKLNEIYDIELRQLYYTCLNLFKRYNMIEEMEFLLGELDLKEENK